MNKRRRYKAKRRRAAQRIVQRDQIGRRLAEALGAAIVPMPFPLRGGYVRIPGH